jgi:phosphate-selective porin OprO/OprP
MGRFKVPVGLETLQSTTGLMHVERGFPTGLVPGRDVGVMLTGSVARNRLQYALGVFDGTPGTSEPGTDVDNTKEGAARLFATPFVDTGGLLKGLGVGIAGTFGAVTGTSMTSGLRSLSTTGRQTFFQYRSDARADGRRWRVAPQARLFVGPVEVLGEYTVAGQDVRRGTKERALTHRAWQVSGSVVLTGERAREGEVVPRDPFRSERGTGAVEVGARVHEVALDDTTVPTFAVPAAAADAWAWGLTLNWYPNAMVRMMLGYERTTFEAAGTEPTRESENVLLARVQLAF